MSNISPDYGDMYVGGRGIFPAWVPIKTVMKEQGLLNSGGGTVDLSNYYTKPEVDYRLAQNTADDLTEEDVDLIVQHIIDSNPSLPDNVVTSTGGALMANGSDIDFINTTELNAALATSYAQAKGYTDGALSTYMSTAQANVFIQQLTDALNLNGSTLSQGEKDAVIASIEAQITADNLINQDTLNQMVVDALSQYMTGDEAETTMQTIANEAVANLDLSGYVKDDNASVLLAANSAYALPQVTGQGGVRVFLPSPINVNSYYGTVHILFQLPDFDETIGATTSVTWFDGDVYSTGNSQGHFAHQRVIWRSSSAYPDTAVSVFNAVVSLSFLCYTSLYLLKSNIDSKYYIGLYTGGTSTSRTTFDGYIKNTITPINRVDNLSDYTVIEKFPSNRATGDKVIGLSDIGYVVTQVTPAMLDTVYATEQELTDHKTNDTEKYSAMYDALNLQNASLQDQILDLKAGISNKTLTGSTTTDIKNTTYTVNAPLGARLQGQGVRNVSLLGITLLSTGTVDVQGERIYDNTSLIGVGAASILSTDVNDGDVIVSSGMSYLQITPYIAG